MVKITIEFDPGEESSKLTRLQIEELDDCMVEIFPEFVKFMGPSICRNENGLILEWKMMLKEIVNQWKEMLISPDGRLIERWKTMLHEEE